MERYSADAYAHCEALVREADKDHWLAALFAPAAERRHLHALRAFAIEIGSVRRRVTQPLAGELRLQWWRDLVDGEARGEASANPVAAALIETVARHHLSRAVLIEAIEAHRLALYGEALPDVLALETLCDATVGGVMALQAQCLMGSDVVDRDLLHHGGVALGVAELIRTLPHRASEGFPEVPEAMLARHGAHRTDRGGRSLIDAIPGALTDLRAVARDHLAVLRDRRQSIDERMAPVLLPLNLVEPLLRAGEAPGADPFAEVLALPQWRRQWIFWRAARCGGML